MNNKRHMKTKSIILAGMFAAILSVMSQIAIPMPTGVPVTLQTFAIALAGCVLGWRLGTMATFIYILIGAVGVPVFTNFGGGLGILFGKTGGFIFGFIFMVWLCGIGAQASNRILTGVYAAFGLGICHLLGILQFMLLTKTSFIQAALLVSVPFLIKDVISVAAAFIAGKMLKKTLYAAHILEIFPKTI